MRDNDKSREDLLQDISALRQQVSALEASETRHQRLTEAWRDLWAQFEAIVEAFDGLIYICSQNFEVEFMNQRFIQRTGSYPLGQKCYQALHDRQEVCPWCVNERVFRGDTVHWEVLSPKDHRWYAVVNTPVRHPDGSLSKMAMIQDVTARKEMEESLRRTTRALKTLSACDHALVHATEETAFLQEICRIIVEVGGYRLAWVGFARRDEGKSVQPVAQAGFEEGYLQTANITWADTERGRGPTGRAIRTGKAAAVTNMITDPAFAPWREEARRRGYASSLALPLKAEEQVIGALNIYAQEPDAFDPEEMQLLEELARDVAFGIVTLRTRAARKQVEQALRQAEAKYRGIFEHAVEGIFQSTPDGGFISVNPALARMCGYDSPEEMMAAITHIDQQLYVDGQSRARFKALLEKADVVQGFETQLHRRDGGTVRVSVNARAVRDEQGAVSYYEGFVQAMPHGRRAKA